MINPKIRESMFTIRKATTDDCALIHKLAQQVFPATYREILTPEQIDYMMEWMYAEKNIRKQMEEEGHVYLLAYEECEAAGYVSVRPDGEDLFHLEKIYKALHFYEHMGMKKVREGDFPIGNGFYMNDYIMGISI